MKESEYAMKQAMAKIGVCFSNALPSGWTDFMLHMFVPAKAAEEFYLLYSMDAGKTWVDLMKKAFEDDELLIEVLDGQNAAKELYELCAFEDDRWTEMTYTLKRDGKFNCDFDYKKMDYVTMDQRKLWHNKATK